MRKVVVLLLVAVSFLSCSHDEEYILTEKESSKDVKTASRLQPAVNIKMHNVYAGSSNGYYGQPGSISRRFEVEVRDVAYEKDVAVLHELTDGTWEYFPMSYVKSTTNNTEIWGYDYNGANTEGLGNQFVFRYIVNGTEYWDNNNGQNYDMSNVSGRQLGNDVNILNTGGFVFSKRDNATGEIIGKRFDITANLKNIGYAKEVVVVYTTDGWLNSNTAHLEYKSSQTIGNGVYVQSPNAFGVEFWASFDEIILDSAISAVEYAIVYKVNGQEYWDNNFGQNYQATIYE